MGERVSRAGLSAVVASNPGAVYTAAQLADRAADVVTRPVLPVPPALAVLFPGGGLSLGTTLVVRGSGAVLLSLLAATTQQSWAAVVGMPDLGLLAAAECGVDTERLALVSPPGAQVGDVVAALLDGFALVAVAAEQVVGADQRGVMLARRLSSRARNRAAVLLAYGSWPTPDLSLECSDARWRGLGDGHGHLATQEITVVASGRGVAGQARRACLHWPAGQSSASAGTDHWRPPDDPTPRVDRPGRPWPTRGYGKSA